MTLNPAPPRRRLLTVTEYAALTRVPEQTVRHWLRHGSLRGRDLNAGKAGRRHARWRVLASEVDRYRRRAGHPRGGGA